MDVFLPALLRSARLSVGVATTTEVCRAAQAAHSLGPTAAIALGRLLTASALAGLIQPKAGGLSLQVLGQGRLGQAFADVTMEGHLRGYVRNSQLALPLLPGEQPQGRRRIGHAVGTGMLSVIRLGEGSEFVQSTTELLSGEIDEDVEHFLQSSEQIATCLRCDVLLDEQERVRAAGGVLVQALPRADTTALADLRQALATDQLTDAVSTTDGAGILEQLLPGARSIAAPQPLAWQCRCSYERVLAALRTLATEELADAVEKAEAPTVTCDFCGKRFNVTSGELTALYQERL